jgi:hypothetical protein
MTQTKSGNYFFSSYGRLGILLSVIGVFLAIDSFTDAVVLYKLWPLLLTLLGTGFFGIYIQRARREGSYISVGTFIVGLSALALYCNFTSWNTLSSLWPVFIALLGVSMVTCYLFGNRRPAILLTGLLFISLAIAFYLIFSFNNSLWWTIFILAGCSFVVFDRARQSR